MATSTKNPADSSRTCPIARQRLASGVAANWPREKIRQTPRRLESEITPARAKGARVPQGGVPRCHDADWQTAGSAGLLAGQILLEPVDVVVAVDDRGLAHQRTEQR